METRLTEHQKTILIKIIVVFYGLLAIGVSFLAQALQGTVVQAALSFVGSVNGPLTGMFLLGALFPCANKYGVVSGALVGVGFSLWLSVGSYLHGIPLPQKPYPNGTCHVTAGNWSTTNVTSLVLPDVDAAIVDRGILHNFYSISYLWYSAIGIITVIFVGLLVSFITGRSSTGEVPLKYQIPVCSRLCCCLPVTWLRKFNCHRTFDECEGQKPDTEENELHVLDTRKPIHKGEMTYHVTRADNNGKTLLETDYSNGCVVGGPSSGAVAVEEINLLLQESATKTG
ncbi:sodium-dependent multivitamin transporter-like [Physella acuta]|uniref:sodium-dependent multivitamin transporter-like n=1 Tax=Physella acuta TaxID=109671 RepID=UPI0027DE8CA5|nr:sodium-dependent multivitamin transporter-like [Physella acuta]